MKKIIRITLFGWIACLSFPSDLLSQYVEVSHVIGGAGDDEVLYSKVINGESYIFGRFRSNDFESQTAANVYPSSIVSKGYYVLKLGVNGEQMYKTYLSSSLGDFTSTTMTDLELQIHQGKVYIAGNVKQNSDLPGLEVFQNGGQQDNFLLALNLDGTLQFAERFGGVANDYVEDLIVNASGVYIAGSTESAAFMGSNSQGKRDLFVSKFGLTGGHLVSRLFGSNQIERGAQILLDNTDLYLVGNSVKNGNDVFAAKLATSNLSSSYEKYIGGQRSEIFNSFKIWNGQLVITGQTTSPDFPETDNSQYKGGVDLFVARLNNNNGKIQYATILGGNGDESIAHTVLDGSKLYVNGQTSSINYPGTTSPNSGQEGLSFISTIDLAQANGSNTQNIVFAGRTNDFQVFQNEQYVTGYTSSPDFITTDGSSVSGKEDVFLIKLDNQGVIFATIYGAYESDWAMAMLIEANAIHLTGWTKSEDQFFSTVGDYLLGGSQDYFYLRYDQQGRIGQSTVIGGNSNELSKNLALFDGSLIFIDQISYVSANDYPQTTAKVPSNVVNSGNSDAYYTKYKLCANVADFVIPAGSIITENIPTVCKRGFVDAIRGKKIEVPSSALPIIYRNGVAILPFSVEAAYQWQSSLTGTASSFQDIPNATSRNYTPLVGDVDIYYRRLAYSSSYCGATTTINTSNVTAVTVNSFTAPIVDAGGTNGQLIICNATGFDLGGSPTATNGTAPFTYNWQWNDDTNPESTLSNPTISNGESPGGNKLYRVLVTDANNCQQRDQLLVTVLKADAGPDQYSCDPSDPEVTLQANFILGVDNLTYSWSPIVDGIVDTDGPQPTLSPTEERTLTLTLTYVLGSTSCVATDDVQVGVIQNPLENFEGDQTICLGSVVTIGPEADENFSYSWLPLDYLTAKTTKSAQATFTSEDLDFPLPFNPMTYTVTAKQKTCAYSADVDVTILRSDAGNTGCGPRWVGGESDDPQLNETFLWEKVSGNGTFIGATDQAKAIVSASEDIASVYRLTVSLNGVSCPSLVNVPPCVGPGGGGGTGITVTSAVGCAKKFNSGDEVFLTANPLGSDPAEFTYLWSVLGGGQTGLLSWTEQTVQLDTEDEVTFQVVMTSRLDNTLTEIQYIKVNGPMVIPEFTTQSYSNACVGDPVLLGEVESEENGIYSYKWSPLIGLSDQTSSNPTLTVPNTPNPGTPLVYEVTVTDPETKCSAKFTSSITISQVLGGAGKDWDICKPTEVTLGGSAETNYTYNWILPESAAWKPDAGQKTLASATALIGVKTTFTLEITNDHGCKKTDEVTVNVFNDQLQPPYDILPAHTICLGQSVRIGPSNPSLSLGYDYVWTGSDGSSYTIANPLVSPTNSATYQLALSVKGGCVYNYTVKVNVREPTLVTFTNRNYCPTGGALTLGMNDGGVNEVPAGPYQYFWEPSYLISGSTTVQNPSTVVNTPQTETVAYLILKNEYGCYSRNELHLVPLLSSPYAGQSDILCLGEERLIGSSVLNPVAGGITYAWTGNNGIGVADLSDPNIPNPTFNPIQAGTYTYTISKTDPNVPSCVTANNVTIQVNQVLAPDPYTVTICGNSSAVIGPISTGKETYAWDMDFPATLSSYTIARPTATPTSSKTYFYTVSEAGCSDRGSVFVSVLQNASPTVTLTDKTVCLSTGETALDPTITPEGSYNYSWSPIDGIIAQGNSGPYVKNPRINLTGGGIRTFELTVTNSTTFCQTKKSMVVTIENCTENCQVSIDGPPIYAGSNSFAVSALGSPAGGTYTWNTGQIGADIVVQPTAEDIFLEVTYTVGECIATENVTIPFDFEHSCDFVGIDISENSKCDQVPQRFSIGGACSFSPNVTYLWNFGDGSATSNEVEPVHSYSAGSYTVTVDVTITLGTNTRTETFTRNLTIENCIVECKDCIPSFSPKPGRYIISGWVKERVQYTVPKTYTHATLEVTFLGANLEPSASYEFNPQGEIIDDWQRIEGELVVPNTATDIIIKMKTTDTEAYFDDIRFFPFDASMMSYVYDPMSLRLMSELDERNYATLYEYDEEGKLIRVKKETERGIMTIQENRDNMSKKAPKQ